MLFWEFKAVCNGYYCQIYDSTSWGTVRNCLIPLVALFVLCAAGSHRVYAQQREAGLQLDFEDSQMHWKLGHPALKPFVALHENSDVDHQTGARCERVIFKSREYLEGQRLLLAVPQSLIFDELSASVWVRANCPDLRLVMQLRFPHQIDPRTGDQLTLELAGDFYSEIAQWQRLDCRATEAALVNRLNLLRAQLSSQGNPIEIDTREVFVDQLALHFTLREGESAIQIDNVAYGPIVRPSELVLGPVQERTGRRRLKIFDDRILKDEHPFFPVFTLYHGESLQEIQATGVNTLWIPDYADRALLQALAEMDIGAFAQPPQLTPEEAVLKRKGLPAFQDWTEPVWGWMFGFEIPEEDVRYLESWVAQVRDADQHLLRPIMADVTGQERAFHRKVDLLGSSQFVIHSAISMPRHAKQLKHRRNLALPGKPMFTFVQTEASAAYQGLRTPEQSRPVIEPEQILHQGYAAIAAGFKGVGFWKQIPLDADIPGLNERVHAIKLFALHCQILQPFLATGRVIDDLPVRVDTASDRVQTGLYAPLKSRWDTPIEQVTGVASSRQSEILATVLRSDDGILILPVWYEENEQCVPGPQAAKGIRMLLKGDIWQAWEVTPVGVTQSNLEVSWPAGGTEICLKEFDQQSAIIITDNPAVIERLQRDCRRVREEAGRAMVSLAALKFERVKQVHEELRELNASHSQAELALRQAYAYLETAGKEQSAGHSVEAYSAAQKSLQYLRSLQRVCWEAAIMDLPSVVTSLDATGFQTLPDHWRMLQELGARTRTSPNLIPSGDFESTEAMVGLWSNETTEAGIKRIQREPDPLRNDYHLALQLESDPSDDASIVLASPEVAVSKDDIVVITAQVRIVQPFQSAEDGFLVFDTLVGSQGAVRYTQLKEDWQTLKIVRRVNADSRLRIRFELRGNGAVEIDDLRVHRLLP